MRWVIEFGLFFSFEKWNEVTRRVYMNRDRIQSSPSDRPTLTTSQLLLWFIFKSDGRKVKHHLILSLKHAFQMWCSCNKELMPQRSLRFWVMCFLHQRLMWANSRGYRESVHPCPQWSSHLQSLSPSESEGFSLIYKGRLSTMIG